MPIRVRTESAITGDDEHVVTEDGLRAHGIEPKDTDPTEVLVRELVAFLGWLQANDALDLHGADEENFEYAARLYVGRDK